MINTGKLAGKTVFITGASRGIGASIALKVARDGANVVIAAKTAEPHPKLPGTIHSVAEEVEKLGGKCLPCIVDVRNEEHVFNAVQEAVKKFGGIDVLVNNASAIQLSGTLETDMKRYDLMNNVNTRGTYLASKLCIPYLKQSSNPHILTLSPPLNLNPRWFRDHVAYTIAKYGMSMCVLGMAEEFRDNKIAVNALWPKTAIQTAAVKMLGGETMANQSRKPEIVSDAAYVIITKSSGDFTGNFCIDETVLRDVGLTDADINNYSVNPGATPVPDFFLDEFDDFAKTLQSSTPAGTSASVGADETQEKILGIFKAISALTNEEVINKTASVYNFTIKDLSDKDWHMDLKNIPGKCGRGEAPNPDVTFTLKANDFVQMFEGKLKPTVAFMSGKLKIKGDVGKAMKLEKLMKYMK